MDGRHPREGNPARGQNPAYRPAHPHQPGRPPAELTRGPRSRNVLEVARQGGTDTELVSEAGPEGAATPSTISRRFGVPTVVPDRVRTRVVARHSLPGRDVLKDAVEFRKARRNANEPARRTRTSGRVEERHADSKERQDGTKALVVFRRAMSRGNRDKARQNLW
jgi:hypothetical protein